MSPSKKKAARKARPKPAAKAKAKAKAKARVKRAAPRRAAPARRAPAPARSAPPALPPPRPWSADIVGLNLVYFNVRDWEAAKRFYGETLGFAVAFGGDEMGWIEYGGKELPHFAIGKGDAANPPYPAPAGSSGGYPVFTCPDVRRAMARLQARGVRCGEIQEIPGMVLLGVFYDPEGNKLQLAQSLAPQA